MYMHIYAHICTYKYVHISIYTTINYHVQYLLPEAEKHVYHVTGSSKQQITTLV